MRDPGQRRPQDQPPPGSATPAHGHYNATNEHAIAEQQDPPFSERGRSPRRRRRRPAFTMGLTWLLIFRNHNTNRRAAYATPASTRNCATNEAIKPSAKP